MHSNAVHDEALRLRAEGLSFQKIADRMGLTWGGAYSLVKRKRRRPECPECASETAPVAAEGKTLRWACVACGHAITRWERLDDDARAASTVSSMASMDRRRAECRRIVARAKDRPCARCGESYPTWAMEFHHLRDKAFNISIAGSRTPPADVLRAEIAKCEVLCGGCHRAGHSGSDAVYFGERRYVVEWQRRARAHAKAVVRAAKDKPCRDCGKRYPHWAMHLHHVRGRKLFAVANGTLRPMAELLAEIAKCDVLCGGCHRDVHAGPRPLAQREAEQLALSV